MASAVARAYNGGLGAVPPAGSRSRAPGHVMMVDLTELKRRSLISLFSL